MRFYARRRPALHFTTHNFLATPLRLRERPIRFHLNPPQKCGLFDFRHVSGANPEPDEQNPLIKPSDSRT